MKNIQPLLLFSFIFLFFPFLCVAQSQPLSRTQLQDYTNSTIYQNPTHAITGQSLQNAFSNYNSSCMNLRTDTMFILLFDSTYTYYFGMKVLIPDTAFSTQLQPPIPPFQQYQPNQNNQVSFPFQGIMRCDTLSYKGHFDTIHFKPIKYGNWNNY